MKDSSVILDGNTCETKDFTSGKILLRIQED